MKNQRVSKEERKKNALQFRQLLSNRRKMSIIIDRHESTSNPNVQTVQFLAENTIGTLSVIAESKTMGIAGCFTELVSFINGRDYDIQTIINLLNTHKGNWLTPMAKELGCRITYWDSFVMIAEI